MASREYLTIARLAVVAKRWNGLGGRWAGAQRSFSSLLDRYTTVELEYLS